MPKSSKIKYITFNCMLTLQWDIKLLDYNVGNELPCKETTLILVLLSLSYKYVAFFYTFKLFNKTN